MDLNVDGVWAGLVAYDGDMLQGILDIFRAGTFPGWTRNMNCFNSATIGAGMDIINDLMAQTITLTAATSGPDTGYETGVYGTLVPDDPFGFTINELSERSNDVTLIVNGIVAQTIFDTITIDGVTLTMLAADTFSTGAGVSTWTFDSTALLLVDAVVYPVVVKTS